MRFTSIGGAAALLIATLAAPAWAQTTGSDSTATDAPAAEAKPAQTGEQSGGTAAQPAPTDERSGEQTGEAQPAQTGEQSGEAAATVEDEGYAMGDIVLGDPDAPLTVIEYASFTCPHCGNFAVNTFPEVKEKYIDTGKVKFILREVYFDQYGLWASMVARCGGEKGFYPLVETFLETQSTWTRAPDIGSAIQQVGRRAGLSAARLEACLSDRDFAKELLAAYQQNMEADEIKSTPTFLIGGEKVTGALSFEEFSGLLDAQL